MARILAPLFVIATPVAAAPDGLPGQSYWLGVAWAALLALPVMTTGLARATVRGHR